ncbi:hypothetical protein LCGC14_0985140 [marine sediment metagenome]|uniref:Uncharacterized protein n=1 Tax=marine sediment metagenome TaxID=412755 RepID=A0A0F9RE21_9ZZZZ
MAKPKLSELLGMENPYPKSDYSKWSGYNHGNKALEKAWESVPEALWEAVKDDFLKYLNEKKNAPQA